MRQILLTAVVALAALVPSGAVLGQDEVVSGTARAIDADMLQFEDSKLRIILWGVDAPDRDQFCRLSGATFACYEAAIRALETYASRGEVSCTLVGDPDPFRRRYGICTAEGDVNINDAMVREGLAFAFTPQSEDYKEAQEAAETAEAGLFQKGMKYELPWVARAERNAGTR